MAKPIKQQGGGAKLTPKPPIAAVPVATPPPAKSKPTIVNADVETIAAEPAYEPSEQVIKEIMVQKQVSRDQAVRMLKNPTK